VHYQINRCRGCRLVYSSPILDADAVAGLYTHAISENVSHGEEGNVRRTFEGYYRLARGVLTTRNRFLDVGCDIGLLLDIAREDGFTEVWGLEPNAMAAARARAVPGSRVQGDFYEAVTFPPGHFDLVALIHVVDHLVDVGRFLAKVQHDLKPGGVVLTVVHNVESLMARVLGERFPPYNAYHHYFFGPRTLAALFTRAGFEVVTVRPTTNRYSLGFFVRRLPLVPPWLRGAVAAALTRAGVAAVPLTLRLGNIGIVARKPVGARASRPVG
jgi:SAM-dependent methyltransferase